MKHLLRIHKVVRQIILILLFISTAAFPLQAQQQTETEQPSIKLKQGSILTGFSAGWASSSRDDHNHEFERGISQLSFNIDALYFFSNQFAIGPELSYQYLYRDFENPFETGENASNDRWDWDITYGGQVGWFISTEKLFGISALGQSIFFTKGGVNWQRTQWKIERNEKMDPEIQVGYAISTGLLIPLGQRIGLEASLQYQARRTEYQEFTYNGNLEDRELVREDVRWPSIISLGIGLKIRF